MPTARRLLVALLLAFTPPVPGRASAQNAPVRDAPRGAAPRGTVHAQPPEAAQYAPVDAAPRRAPLRFPAPRTHGIVAGPQVGEGVTARRARIADDERTGPWWRASRAFMYLGLAGTSYFVVSWATGGDPDDAARRVRPVTYTALAGMIITAAIARWTEVDDPEEETP